MTDLIFDRAITDIETDTDKAYWQASDLIRINEWIAYLSDKFNLKLIITPLKFGDCITETIITGIIINIAAIRARAKWISTPATPNSTAWGYSKANDTEQILYDANWWYNSKIADYKYSGQIYSGQAINI